MTLYFISGLGADKRIFEKLLISNSHKIVYLDWIVPLQKESIGDYAKRMSQNINTHEPFCIIGLSFGGMIATEMSKFLSPKKIILISSISLHKERPVYFQIFKAIPIYKFVSKNIVRRIPFFVYKLMGVENKDDKILFDAMLAHTNIDFFKWAIPTIMNWKQDQSISNLHHIHGSADLVFPIKKTHPNYIINEGTHLMVYSKAAEISSILSEIIED